MVHTPLQLDMVEEAEFEHLGILFAQMPWLSLFSESKPFIEGVKKGKGLVQHSQGPSLDAYDAVISYKRSDKPKKAMLVDIKTFSQLQRLVSDAVKELYERGIIT